MTIKFNPLFPINSSSVSQNRLRLMYPSVNKTMLAIVKNNYHVPVT